MAMTTETQSVDIRRTVVVTFDPDNCPEFDRGGKHYRLVSARIAYSLRGDEWRSPWLIQGSRQQRIKDGSWGKSVHCDISTTDIVTELSNEYRPTAIINITEESK